MPRRQNFSALYIVLLVVFNRVVQALHGQKKALFGLLRGKQFKRFLARKFDVVTHSVGKLSRLHNERAVGVRNTLHMNISVEVVNPSQFAYRFGHQLHGFVGISEHGGGQEQPLDIVAPVKVYYQLAYFVGRKACPPYVCAPPVRAVFAVVNAVVAHKYFQKRNTSSVWGKGVANSADGGVPQPARLVGSSRTRRGAGHVVFCAFGQNFKFICVNHSLSDTKSAVIAQNKQMFIYL